MRDFTILFDDGGGALLMTRGYCHAYDGGKQLARDVLALIGGSDPREWEGNEPEYRRAADPTDTSESRDSIMSVVRCDEQLRLPSGATHREFWAELSPSEFATAEARGL